MIYKIQPSNQFKKDVKLAKKRGYNLNLLTEIIKQISEGKQLDLKNRDHELSGNFKGFRECHIQPDWLLIYKISNDLLILYLTRTGTHSDLF